MQTYVLLDGNAMPIAFYNDHIYPPKADGSQNDAIPAAAVPISEGVWQDCINNPGLRQIVAGASVVFTPAITATVPQFVSRRQFAVQASIENDITQDEALAWLAGTVPAILTSAIGKLPAAQQFPALTAMLAESFDRQSSWAATLGAVLNKTDAQLDAMWTAAAAIT